MISSMSVTFKIQVGYFPNKLDVTANIFLNGSKNFSRYRRTVNKLIKSLMLLLN
jgi:hypothetical protein